MAVLHPNRHRLIAGVILFVVVSAFGLFAGYRFRRRYAELRLGLLNMFDADYRLNPLNLYPELPRGRTLAVSLRLNF